MLWMRVALGVVFSLRFSVHEKGSSIGMHRKRRQSQLVCRWSLTGAAVAAADCGNGGATSATVVKVVCRSVWSACRDNASLCVQVGVFCFAGYRFALCAVGVFCFAGMQRTWSRETVYFVRFGSTFPRLLDQSILHLQNDGLQLEPLRGVRFGYAFT
jgi:hypothetical protein